MLVPFNSDAPLYHPPIATVGLIVVNILLFFLWPPRLTLEDEIEQMLIERLSAGDYEEPTTEEEAEALIEKWLAELPAEVRYPDERLLHMGNGLRPWQWVTANFMHADIVHLLGNMIFLWGLGLVVEGKVGWWRFLVIYLLIGTIGYGLVQLIMFSSTGNALGASLPIYGIMVLALLWAPLNDLKCILTIGFRFWPIDISILHFSAAYLGLQVLLFFFWGMQMGSEALHLIGALVGLPVGLLMLRYSLVDCEDWDAISVWKGRHEMTREERRTLDEATPKFQAKVANHLQACQAQLEQILQETKDPAQAWALHLHLQHRLEGWKLPESAARTIIRLFLEQKRTEEAVPVMVELIRQQPPERTADIRLILAQQMLRVDRPRQARRVLAPLETVTLSEKQQEARQRLATLTERKMAAVELEEPPEDW